MSNKYREEFEKWGKLNGYESLPSYDMDKNPNKQVRSNVWHAFDGFQAGYNLREQEIQRLRGALELIASKVDNHDRDKGTWINGEWIGVCEIAKQALQQDLTTKE